MPRENRIDQLRDYRFVVTDDAGKQFFAALQFANQIRAHLVFDGARQVATLFEFT